MARVHGCPKMTPVFTGVQKWRQCSRAEFTAREHGQCVPSISYTSYADDTRSRNRRRFLERVSGVLCPIIEQTWRHSQHRKYLTNCIVIRGGPIHVHRYNMHKNFVKFAHGVFDIRERTNIYRHTDTLIAILRTPTNGEVINCIM